MRILLTGITGFVGRHLASALARDGHQVFGCAVGTSESLSGAEVAEIDLLDIDGLTRFVEGATPAVIVHLGGLSHVGASFKKPGAYFRTNVLGTRNIIHASRKAAPGARLVVASSAEVYGRVPDAEQPIAEDRPLDPRSPYAWSKAAAEVMALEADGIVTRAFNIIGPGQAPSFALPSFARQLAAIETGSGPAKLAVGDLSPRRDFLHVDDAVGAYKILIDRGVPGTVYNVARGHANTIAEMLERLRARASVKVEIVRDEARVRPVDVPLLVGDASRLRALGWCAQRPVDQALEALWNEACTARRHEGA